MGKKVSRFKSKMSVDELNRMSLAFKELEYGMDSQTNTIFLNSDISTESLYETLARCNFLVKFNNREITINVSSFGGDIYSMFGIHDFIRNFSAKVNTVCIGPAMSAAAFLLASGTGTRMITKNSTVMFHQVNASVEGKTQSVMLNVAHVKKLQDRVNELLGTYTKKPKSYWQKQTSEDLYLSAEDCLELGVVDKII